MHFAQGSQTGARNTREPQGALRRQYCCAPQADKARLVARLPLFCSSHLTAGAAPAAVSGKIWEASQEGQQQLQLQQPEKRQRGFFSVLGRGLHALLELGE